LKIVFIFFASIIETVYLFDYWSDSELYVYCTKDDLEKFRREKSLVVMNHSYEIDWLIGWAVLEKTGGLGSGRAFTKSQTKYIPIAGWFFWLSGHVFLERSFEKDQKVFEKQLSEYMAYPYSTMTFLTPEGTRFTKEKHEASLKFAQERNLEPLKHHLIPRPKGYLTSIPILKQHKCPAIYNVQILFDKDAPTPATLGNVLMGRKLTAHVYIERIPIDKAEATKEYLQELYKHKDALQDSFHKYGNFYEGRGLKIQQGMRMRPRRYVLINTVVWVAIIMSMVSYYAFNLVAAGKIFSLISISLGVVAISE
jgi:lysophosphatidic acid acyltransferase / lysophosphatidylinositol acyltransferase